MNDDFAGKADGEGIAETGARPRMKRLELKPKSLWKNSSGVSKIIGSSIFVSCPD